jgi:hypothetical protein
MKLRSFRTQEITIEPADDGTVMEQDPEIVAALMTSFIVRALPHAGVAAFCEATGANLERMLEISGETSAGQANTHRRNGAGRLLLLAPEQIAEAQRLYSLPESERPRIRDLAKQFGVSEVTMSTYLGRRKRQHVRSYMALPRGSEEERRAVTQTVQQPH